MGLKIDSCVFSFEFVLFIFYKRLVTLAIPLSGQILKNMISINRIRVLYIMMNMGMVEILSC